MNLSLELFFVKYRIVNILLVSAMSRRYSVVIASAEKNPYSPSLFAYRIQPQVV